MESLYLFRLISVSNMAGSVDRSADKMEGGVGWDQPAPQHRGHKSVILWSYSRDESNEQERGAQRGSHQVKINDDYRLWPGVTSRIPAVLVDDLSYYCVQIQKDGF